VSKLRFIFFAFSEPKFTKLRRHTRERLWSANRLPIVDSLFRSGDNRDKSLTLSEIWFPQFQGEYPQILGPSF